MCKTTLKKEWWSIFVFCRVVYEFGLKGLFFKFGRADDIMGAGKRPSLRDPSKAFLSEAHKKFT